MITRDKILSIIHNAGQSETKTNALFTLRKRGWIRYIFKGYYYLLTPEEKYGKYTQYTSSEMLFTALNKLKINWYLGLQSALEYNNVLWQGHGALVILNNKVSGVRTVQGTKVQFRKMKKEYFFGILSMETKNRITVYYSDKEKTVADFAYFNEQSPGEPLRSIDKEKASGYLNKYSKVVQRRALS